MAPSGQTASQWPQWQQEVILSGSTRAIGAGSSIIRIKYGQIFVQVLHPEQSPASMEISVTFSPFWDVVPVAV
jgi:hypothetical protein